MPLVVLLLQPQDVQYRDTWIGPLHGLDPGASGFRPPDGLRTTPRRVG